MREAISSLEERGTCGVEVREVDEAACDRDDGVGKARDDKERDERVVCDKDCLVGNEKKCN